MKNFIFGVISTLLIGFAVYYSYPYLKEMQYIDKTTLPVYSTKYDPSLDIEESVNQALLEAQKDNQNILIFVGGDWCKWCRGLDKYLDAHKELQTYMYSHYKVVKAYFAGNMSKKNKKYLSKFPKIQGTPHIYVLDKNGQFLYSQGTASFEDKTNYNHEKMDLFFKKYNTFKPNK